MIYFFIESQVGGKHNKPLYVYMFIDSVLLCKVLIIFQTICYIVIFIYTYALYPTLWYLIRVLPYNPDTIGSKLEVFV